PQQGNGQRPTGERRGTISGNAYSNHLIKPRPEAIARKIPDKVEEPVEDVVKETSPAVKPEPQKNVSIVVEEAPKKEYLRRDNSQPRQDRPQRDGQRPTFNRDRNRPQGDRRERGDRPAPQGRDGQRPPRQGDRPGFKKDGQRPAFNRDGNRPQGDRTARPGAGSSFAAAPAMPGKPSGDRRDNKSKNNKNFDPTRDGGKQQNRRNQKDDTRGKQKYITVEDEESLEVKRKKGKFIKPEAKPVVEEEVIKVITLPDTITIKDLADKMKIQPAAIVKKLFLEGKIVTVNQEISFEEAENIAIDYEIICEKEVKVDVIEELLKEDAEDEKDLVERPPVVCVMGHVDHGKTSLLDAIRKTRVTDKEAGGITQAIGAYTVHVKNRDITFLDTPGHEAFTAMRMRGANSTDIAVLVVAADDGVMPQTVEAINHAKAAGVEVIVAVNKIDKPAANPDKVKQELTEYELIPTDWGGTTEFVNISAKRGDGIDDLLETILLTADVLELKANPKRKARGLVIEAELDKGRGPVATVLVQKGTLKVGDFVSAGACHGKVRAMINDKGKNVKTAGPSIPVEILGLNDVPNAGEVFIAHDSDKTAKSYAETFIAQNKEKKLEEIKSRMSLDDLFTKISEGNLKELNIIVKADVQGSVEAVKQSLMKLSNDEVVVKCIHGGVGAINESDVSLAGASDAIIIGFNVKADPMAKATADREGVDVRLYKVIYQAIEDVENAMKGMLDPVFEEKIIGHAEIRQIFKASAIGNIAGSYVLDGMFQKNCKVRVKRGDDIIFEGALASLKRFKDDVKEVKAGFECGLVFEGFDKFEELDTVEAYVMVEVPR
nr:translation initiation factor IF-2 [Lachnospiraceae bacterium]